LTAPRKTPNPDQRDALIDEFITTVSAEVKECRNEDRAGYNPELDCILLPAFGLFRNRAHYAAVLFHELIHWVGHPSRLDRQLGKRFGEL
jgi:antirestriction protein ArdC